MDVLPAIAETERRYSERARERTAAEARLADGGVLSADTPERVERRLARLRATLPLAASVAAHGAAAVGARAVIGDSSPAPVDGVDLIGLERLLGRNDLVGVSFLEAGTAAARSIGRIVVSAPGGNRGGHYGTGFLASPRLLLTNHHVLADAAEAERATVEFNYQSAPGGVPLAPVAFALEPSACFVTDAALDFTFVAVQPAGHDGTALGAFGWERLIEQEGKVILGELLNIVQHPNGEPKQLALRENQLVDVLEEFLHYRTDTAPGSSGAPVFNDQWEVVGLHHSGVPRRDAEGRILTTDGRAWHEEMGEQRIDWVANEGVRISRVLRALRAAALTGEAARLRAELFGAHLPAPQAAPLSVVAAPSPATATMAAVAAVAAAGTVRVTIPLHVTVGLGPASPVPTGPGPSAADAADPDPDLQAALLDLRAVERREYYEATLDAERRAQYYEGVGEAGSGAQLFSALTGLLTASHAPQPRYKPMRHVYPWVDVHPDGRLRSIYSGSAFTPEELIREDARVERQRTERLRELVVRESALGPGELEDEFDALEAALPYNCEHVVPQSWFGKREPMRGDVHHLFACESGCNSFRGNIPYFDFTDFGEVVQTDCGKREPTQFEPVAGKGPAARAVLYFLVRYPGTVRASPDRLQPDRLAVLLDWHRKHPVDDYERHRNVSIHEIQGNRNPFIDHPEWADRIDFAAALG